MTKLQKLAILRIQELIDFNPPNISLKSVKDMSEIEMEKKTG
jgi:hypothetical protein